jgi:hypothetical protein
MLMYRKRDTADDRLANQLRAHAVPDSLTALITLMLDRQPKCRPRASQALVKAREKGVFPTVFYDTLRPVMLKFTRQTGALADDLMAR